MLNFRQETGGEGLSSYPHPWLMPEFWQFPTVSMGLGPLMAIYQARFLRYLHHRGLANTEGRKVWAFLGDGETDEPESLGAISMAVRERLDNLIFVINCNLQRLDGPVRGNGKIIQELEATFRGAGWNVIKVIWGGGWDRLLARDKSGMLLRRMEECVDGEYQDFKSKNGAYVREKFFGKYAETRALVADMSDDEIWALARGGHDPNKVYAAYAAAVATRGRPTVVLAKTVKGYGMGEAGEGQNITHQQKKMGEAHLREFRDRFGLEIADDRLKEIPFLRWPENSPEQRYLMARRAALGGFLPSRRAKSEALQVPDLAAFGAQLKATEGRTISTTMAMVRILNMLMRDKQIGKRVVPIVPDESRTFGMEGMFRQFGIYSQVGQLYHPEDANQLMFYKEDQKGQLLQEGLNEAGGIASWIAAATSYSSSNCPMIPFYIYYSMFGFQRVGDFIWAAGDMRARGFLLGATAGRTTLNGEGLQHEDGHSHLLAATVPNCVAYDPTFSYEVAVIVQDGLRRMYAEQEDVFYYLTLMNENYEHPAMPEGAEQGILKGMYELRAGAAGSGPRVQLLGSGTILNEVIAAAELLEEFGVAADIWSCPSFTELKREGIDAERWNLLHPEAPPRVPYVDAVPHRAAGAGDRRHRLHARPSPSRSGPTCPAATRCLAPTDSGARIIAVGCARSSRWTGISWPSPRSRHSRMTARLPTSVAGGCDPQVRHRSGKAQPHPFLKRPSPTRERESASGDVRDHGSGYRRLQGHPDHRNPCEGRPIHQRGGPDPHARIRQGDDGRAIAARRHDRGAAGESR